MSSVLSILFTLSHLLYTYRCAKNDVMSANFGLSLQRRYPTQLIAGAFISHALAVSHVTKWGLMVTLSLVTPITLTGIPT